MDLIHFSGLELGSTGTAMELTGGVLKVALKYRSLTAALDPTLGRESNT